MVGRVLEVGVVGPGPFGSGRLPFGRLVLGAGGGALRPLLVDHGPPITGVRGGQGLGAGVRGRWPGLGRLLGRHVFGGLGLDGLCLENPGFGLGRRS